MSYTNQANGGFTGVTPDFPLADETAKVSDQKLAQPLSTRISKPTSSSPITANRTGDLTYRSPASQITSYSPPQSVSVTNQAPEENPFAIDWITISMGLLALIAVGGLLPFYLWVFFLYR